MNKNNVIKQLLSERSDSVSWLQKVKRCLNKLNLLDDDVSWKIECLCKRGYLSPESCDDIVNYLQECIDENIIVKDEDMRNNENIFIVHGHNNAMKEHTARLIAQLGFTPIILSEQANRGKTIIEKLEHYSDVCFAIVLYSADDEMNTGEWRGRQNVVFEHGLFIGKLGRENVMCIKEQGVKLPGDIDGIVYADSNNFDANVVKELRAAGFNADMNKLI